MTSLANVSSTLPRSGPAREKLREKGQFWTPHWVAEAMVAWAAAESDHIFDPGVGPGAFFRAAKGLGIKRGLPLGLLGCEVDPAALRQGLEQGLSQADFAGVNLRDFMLTEDRQRFRAIVANPPYVRHHRFPSEYKAMLRAYGLRWTGAELDGRAGLHVFFLIKALCQLEPGGRLAFIVPSDVCEGRFSIQLWSWIGRTFCVDAAVTFAPGASPFPGVDTNPIILLIRHAPPAASLRWARVLQAETEALADWCSQGLPIQSHEDMEVTERATAEALATGLSRPPVDLTEEDTIPFGQLFRVMRGIATGDNDFFFMTASRIRELGLPKQSFLRAIGRTRDHTDGALLTMGHLDALEAQGRPTWLLALGRQPAEGLPEPVRRYLQQGEELGLPQRPLIAQRKPWFRMETRDPPPWLFAYLGRRACRFIRNKAQAMPLTGFLCIYPQPGVRMDFDAATSALNDQRTLANLARVAKSYGGGALKVEPRNLERLAIPRAVLIDHGVHLPTQAKLL